MIRKQPLGVVAVAVVLVVMSQAGTPRNLHASAVSLVDREERTFSVGDRPELIVATLRAAVEIHGWDRKQIHIVVEKRALDTAAAAALVLRTEQHEQHVDIDLRRSFGLDQSGGSNQMVDARISISAPISSAITVETGAGAIDVDDISGNLTLKTRSGAISGRALSGALIALARGGDITIHAPSRTPSHPWDIETIRGNILIECPAQFEADLETHARPGRVVVDNALRDRLTSRGQPLRLTSRNGLITVRAS